MEDGQQILHVCIPPYLGVEYNTQRVQLNNKIITIPNSFSKHYFLDLLTQKMHKKLFLLENLKLYRTQTFSHFTYRYVFFKFQEEWWGGGMGRGT